MNLDLVVPILVALIAAGPGIYSIWVGRRKMAAESGSKLLDMIKGLSLELEREQERRRQMGERVIELESKVLVLENENKMLRDGINRLLGQLMTLGVDPVWKPDEIKKLKGDES